MAIGYESTTREIATENVTLAIERWRNAKRLRGVDLQVLGPESRDYGNELLIGLEAWFAQKHVKRIRKRSAVAQWPSTWWDHFKHRWFPAWARKRWPVQWTANQLVTTIDLYTAWPEEERLNPYNFRGETAKLHYFDDQIEEATHADPP